MSDEFVGLTELCRAIESGDQTEITQRQREFVSRNWTLISTLDRIAQAEFTAGNFEAATRQLELIEAMVPHVSGFFVRRASAAIRAGKAGVLEELGASAHRVSNDNELFAVVEELVANGRADLAGGFLSDCRATKIFSQGILAAAQSRVLATTGRTGEAIAQLAPELEVDKPNLTAMRCAYLLSEGMLQFEAARKICMRAGLIWGEPRELRHLVDRLLFVSDFEAAQSAVDELCHMHAALMPLLPELSARVAAAKAIVQDVQSEFGAVAEASSVAIHEALSAAGNSASKVQWGRAALGVLLRSDRFTEADYALFAWFLPNWEEGLVRNHVLGAALQRFSDSPVVRHAWLHHLVANGIYADAALHCWDVLQQEIGEDTLFFVIMLLRLELDGVLPSFIGPDLLVSLRTEVLQRMPATSPGFRVVMQDHIVKLGGPPARWPADALPPLESPDAQGFRRLFATKTGRLSRVSAIRAPKATGPIRPVLAISGQLRGFEKAWQSMDTHLRGPLNAPVIISVWDKTINATGRHARRLERTLPNDVLAQLKPEERYTDAFELAYPQTYQLLFGQTDVSAEDLLKLVAPSGASVIALETESEQLIEYLMPPQVSSNMLKMYYKFSRLEAIIKQAELVSGELFTHVVWARPDCEILRLNSQDVLSCLVRRDIVWSSFTTESSFGDYLMILPRAAFAALGNIFARVLLAGHTRMMPWRTNRTIMPGQRRELEAFGGPDVLFDTLVSEGYIPFYRIPGVALSLVGRTPAFDLVRSVFACDVRLSAGD